MEAMELRHLRYFVAVAEELHFGRAVYRPLQPRGPQVEMVVAWRRDATSPVVEAFLDVTRRVVAREARRRPPEGRAGAPGRGRRAPS